MSIGRVVSSGRARAAARAPSGSPCAADGRRSPRRAGSGAGRRLPRNTMPYMSWHSRSMKRRRAVERDQRVDRGLGLGDARLQADAQRGARSSRSDRRPRSAACVRGQSTAVTSRNRSKPNSLLQAPHASAAARRGASCEHRACRATASPPRPRRRSAAAACSRIGARPSLRSPALRIGCCDARDLVLQLHDPVDHRLRPRRAAGDVDVDRDDLVDAQQRGVVLVEAAARRAAPKAITHFGSHICS